jgi:ribonuclease HI
MALGEGDNNLGEIVGLLQILVLLDEAYARGLVAGHLPLLLFTDYLLVVGALDWGWLARDMPPLIRDLRHAYRNRKKLTSVALYWVKGHSQITRNEIVNKTAKTGAAGVATASGRLARSGL